MTRISIALATFNGAQFLSRQLESYAGQERLPDELVIGDDGSSDGTQAIIREFAASAPFAVRLLDGPAPGGITANFERVLGACSGDLILLSDQDDVWLPHKIATVERAMAGAPHMLALHHDEWLMDSDSGALLDRTFNQRARRAGHWEHVLYVGNCSAFRRSLLKVILPIPDDQGFDYWLSLVPELLGTRLICDEPLQYWRRHSSNSSQPALAATASPGRWAMARRFAGEDPRPGWANERATLQLVLDRIELHQEVIDSLLGPRRAERTATELKARMAAIDARIGRLSVPRRRRWLGVAAAFGRGEYSSFSGWRSALKDAIRRP